MPALGRASFAVITIAANGAALPKIVTRSDCAPRARTRLTTFGIGMITEMRTCARSASGITDSGAPSRGLARVPLCWPLGVPLGTGRQKNTREGSTCEGSLHIRPP